MTDERRIVTESIFYDRDNPNIEFYFLEQAPPKDWKPWCFEEHSMADSEHCDGVHETNWMGYIQPELEENCRDCIYRKR